MRDVDPVEAVGHQVVDRAGEQHAVGRHRDLADALDRGEAPDQRRAGPGRTSGSPPVTRSSLTPSAANSPHHAHQLVVAEQLLAGAATSCPRPACSSGSAGCSGRSPTPAASGGPGRTRRAGPPRRSSPKGTRPGPAGPTRGPGRDGGHRDSASSTARPVSTRARWRRKSRARPGVARRVGALVGALGRLARPRRGARPRARPPSADARSGVWPMLVRATRAPWIEPLLAPTTAATPTVAQSSARWRNLR